MAAGVEPAVEGTADEMPDDQADDQADDQQPSTELAVVASGGGQIIRADQPDDILAKAGTIATALKRLLEEQQLAVDVGGRRKHVEVGGWQALGTMLGALGGQPLHAETVWTRKIVDPVTGEPVRTTYTATVKRYHRKDQGGGLREEITYDVDGHDWEACVEIRTPDGTVVGKAEAMVSRAEQQWGQSADYAVRSMAETRAESRAFRRAAGWIVHLAGYSPTPAEEMGHQPGGGPDAPAWGPEAALDLKKAALSWVEFVLAKFDIPEPQKAALAILSEIAGLFGGSLPESVAKAMIRLGQRAEQNGGEQRQRGEQPSPSAVADANDASPPPVDATPVDDRPPSGSVPAPERTGDADADLAALRAAGCTCSQPLIVGTESAPLNASDDECPIVNHGIPF